MHRSALIKMTLIGVVVGVATTLVAVLIEWLPDSASEQADRIWFTTWFATVICIVIWALVAAVMLYAIIAFRAQPDDESDGPHIHGSTKLEVIWTVVPAILVIAIGVVSAVVLGRNADAGPNPLTIKIYAQQFAWRFEYPENGNVRSGELVMPVNRAVQFEMHAADVLHSFWIPEMGQKQDLVPGLTNEIIVTPTRTGSFTLICTELCGLGHAAMRAPVRVLGQREFAAWVADKRGGGGEEGGGGKALFTANGCGSCHAFAPAGSTGAIGPPLDDLAAAAEASGMSEAEFVRESIVDPSADVAEGFQDGVMPKTYGESLSKDEIDSLVDFLTGAKGN